MNNREALAPLEELRSDFNDYTSVETKEKDVEALDFAIESLAQEVPVQGHLLEITRQNKIMLRCITIYSITVMILIQLMGYRFNNMIQGITAIHQSNTKISLGVITILETLIEIINRI